MEALKSEVYDSSSTKGQENRGRHAGKKFTANRADRISPRAASGPARRRSSDGLVDSIAVWTTTIGPPDANGDGARLAKDDDVDYLVLTTAAQLLDKLRREVSTARIDVSKQMSCLDRAAPSFPRTTLRWWTPMMHIATEPVWVSCRTEFG